MLKSLIRSVSGVLVAAAAVVSLAGPASAAPAHAPRVHTTLSIVQSRNVIQAGHKDVISGQLVADRQGLAHEIVILDRWYHRWVPVRAGLTGPKGWISFAVWPRVTARYKLVYLGNRTYAPTHSGVVTVKVIQPVTAIN